MRGLQLSRLDRFSFQQAVRMWNEGFAGYFNDMNRTLNQHLEYLTTTGVHPEHSVVAVIDGKPAGFVLTAIRASEGGKTAWNAGTGVVPSFRGTGVGKAMMDEVVKIYRELGIHTAYLEAIFENHAALALYGRSGFQVRERLFCYSRKGPSEHPLFSKNGPTGYRMIRASLRETGQLSFYRGNVAWCSQWPNVHEGEALLVLDEQDVIVGYALYKRSFTTDGTPAEIRLLQGEVDPKREDGTEVARFLLGEIYGSHTNDLRRTAENIPESNAIICRLLQEEGFEIILDQNLMSLDLNMN